ncbi:MAG: ornithine/acetylornithine aminotransferase [Actinomycetia bacterium]|jgi:ornithine--oxo-acid transaminase|nr:ornithine/acetylornithine aminotransferase [Actinomycetes bacterium]
MTNESFDLKSLLAERDTEAFALHERYMNPQMPRILRTIGFDADYVRAEGAYLFDRDGRRYLDFLSGFGVFALGRCHPGIEQALRDAMDLALPNLVQMECAPLSGLLAEALVKRMPDDDYRCFFTNSGAESVETAIKYARCATGKGRVLFADHAFHGLTMGALSLNGAREFRDRFGALLPGCQSVPFGDLLALERELAAGDVAAYAVEPIQGKGVFVAPEGYLRAAADLCHRHGALLVVDEVQTGLGRSGTFFAFEQSDVVPDIVTIAKALSGGYVPVGAVIAKGDVVERVFDKMDRAVVHSSTFGQNVLGMTAGLATLHFLDAESIVERASTVGAALMSGLEAVKQRHELVHDVRGRGLMIGIEFSRPRSMRLRVQWTLLESMRTGLFTQMVIVPLFRDHGILSQVAGDHQNVLKILPPLITTHEQANEFVDAIDDVLGELERSLGLLWGVGSSLALPALRARR